MKFYEICMLSVALAMDSVAVTISNCTIYKNLTKKYEYLMPITFGVFQGVMTLSGYLLSDIISDHIKFTAILPPIIFSALALKTFLDKIIDNIKTHKNKVKPPEKFTFITLLFQGIATSIDALAIGITLNSSVVNITLCILTISLITFILVTVALISGKKAEKVFGKYTSLAGGIILLALAIKSFIQLI